MSSASTAAAYGAFATARGCGRLSRTAALGRADGRGPERFRVFRYLGQYRGLNRVVTLAHVEPRNAPRVGILASMPAFMALPSGELFCANKVGSFDARVARTNARARSRGR